MIYLWVGLCLCLIWYLFKKDAGPPVLSGKLPLIGHGLRFLGDSEAMYNAITNISEECLKNGGVLQLKIGPITIYGITDPEDSFTVAFAGVKKSFVYDLGRRLLGNGLLSADVLTWKKHRKLLNPAFGQQILDSFIDIFNSQSRSLVDQFSRNIGESFDHDKILRRNNLETICSTATGVEASEYINLQKEYLPRFENVLHIFNQRFQKFWLLNDYIFSWSSLKKELEQDMEYVEELPNSIIRKKKTELKNSIEYIESKPGKLKPFIDLIFELAKEEKSFTDEQILAETNTIIAGGHDTTASALSIALTLLGSYPEVQEKVYEEILQVFGNSDGDVDKYDLSKLMYTEAVIKETLRLYPSIPIIGRFLEKDTKIKNYTLKANTDCIISIYGINRHPVWGPDANEFRPARWLDKDSLPDPKYHALFGQGRRTCIGKTYALMAMKITLVHVLRKYKILSDISKMVLRMDIMLRPASGFHISLTLRK